MCQQLVNPESSQWVLQTFLRMQGWISQQSRRLSLPAGTPVGFAGFEQATLMLRTVETRCAGVYRNTDDQR